MRYLRKFQNHAEYEQAKQNLILPNISLCKQENETHFNALTYDKLYLTFIALEDGTFSFSSSINYSIDDGATWVELPSGTNTPTIEAGNKIMWKKTYETDSSIGTFSSSGNFDVEGNIMSLLYGDNFVGQKSLEGKYGVFDCLFEISKVVNARNLSLPATTLAQHCYNGMFGGCTNLTTAPSVLPATTLDDGCYYYMFNSCTSLTTAPQLPATTLAYECYQFMFNSCTSLATAPELPATTLAEECYDSMFYGCTSLTTAPQLPATTLAEYCYYHMFAYCTSLNSITCLATDISANDCTTDWVKGVAANGTFTKAVSMGDWTTGDSGIPNGWTVNDYIENALVIYIDDFPYQDYGSKDDLAQDWGYEDWNDYLDTYLGDLDRFGSNQYMYTGDTFVWEGQTYYLFKMVENGSYNSAVEYLLTNTIDYNVLNPMSLESDYTNEYCPYVALLNEDYEVYDHGGTIRRSDWLVKVIKY